MKIIRVTESKNNLHELREIRINANQISLIIPDDENGCEIKLTTDSIHVEESISEIYQRIRLAKEI